MPMGEPELVWPFCLNFVRQRKPPPTMVAARLGQLTLPWDRRIFDPAYVGPSGKSN